MKTLLGFTCATLALCLAGCGGQTNQADPADASAPIADAGARDATPPFHRPAAVACTRSPSSRPNPLSCCLFPDAGPLSQDGTCTTDSECGDSQGLLGHCIAYPGAPTKQCNYDGCLVDSDCGDSGVCACQGTDEYAGNVCEPSNCRVDGDCPGPSGMCALSSAHICHGGLGWYCHTPADECTVNEDCETDATPYGFCSFQREVGHWACVVSGGCTG